MYITSILTRINIDMHTKKNQNTIKGISVFMLLFKNYYGKSMVNLKNVFRG